MSERAEILETLRNQENPTLIGLGAIGSWVARWLIANGIRFHAYDNDTVSLKNCTAGAFAPSDAGRYKADIFIGSSTAELWNPGFHSVGTAVLVCADHGPSRREAAAAAYSYRKPFICAKANGALWQVWHVERDNNPTDFLAFDEAAEANPVATPCGEPTVGRVASLGAAAELLSAWTGLDITAEEVEASYGVAFDPALGHVLNNYWQTVRADADAAAQEAAKRAYDAEIDRQRAKSDSAAMDHLGQLRLERKARQYSNRSTIHMRAVVRLDGMSTISSTRVREAAIRAVSGYRYLENLARVEAQIEARTLNTRLSIPDTITVEEAIAS